jgi:5-methylcytosine-specific restriction protein B
MMNTADRSLALVDYALRRRFAFIELEPLFGSPVFAEYLTASGADPNLVSEICKRLESLNRCIADDQNLGNGFRVGHSYFCGSALAIAEGAYVTEEAYRRAVKHEILPLLKEYWFDDREEVNEWATKLRAKFV